MNEQDVRQMLQRRAGDATTSPDAWERIAERIDGDEAAPAVVELAARRPGFKRPVVLGSIAAALLMVVATLTLVQDATRDETIRAADNPSPSPSPDSGPGPIAAVAFSDKPVWPATTDEGLARFQAEADAGRRPDLLDPKEAAGAYLSDRLLDDSTRRPAQDFAVGQFLPSDPHSGEVRYESPPGGPDGGTVLVRRSGGEGAIWSVVGANSSGVYLKVAAYDGTQLTGEASAARSGTLKISISSTDGSGPVSYESRSVTAGKPIALRQRFAGKPGAILQLRLLEPAGTMSFAEYRVDRLPTGGPPPQTPEQVNAEAAARRWIRALAAGDGDVAWDLLAEGSRKAAGGRSGFESRLTDLAEGWGAWDAAPQASYRAVSLTGEMGVVLVSGRVSQEGTTAVRTMSLPVRFTADKAQVDPFSDVAIELQPDPDRGARITSDGVLGAYTPGAAKVWFILDEREPAAPDMSEDADGDLQHVTIEPDPALAPGQHSLTVVVLTVDGRVASRSTTFSVT